MGTEKIEVYRDVCHCGTGQIVIDLCMPDYGWPTKSKSFDPHILCENCSGKFELIKQNNSFALVNRSDLEAREKISSEYQDRSNKLMDSPETQTLLTQLRVVLDSQPSLTACYRLLQANNLVSYESVNTFRRWWRGSSHWIRNNIRADNLNGVIRLLQLNDPKVSNELSELEVLRKKRQTPLTVVGQPIVIK